MLLWPLDPNLLTEDWSTFKPPILLMNDKKISQFTDFVCKIYWNVKVLKQTYCTTQIFGNLSKIHCIIYLGLVLKGIQKIAVSG